MSRILSGLAMAAAALCSQPAARAADGFAEQAAHLDDPAAYAAVVKGGRAALPDTIAALKGPRPDLAAQALGSMALPDAAAALIPLLKDRDGELRAAVAWALGRCASPEAVAALLPIAADPYGPARAAAVGALAQLKDGKADAALLDALASPDEEVRLAAVDVLGGTGRKDLIGPLLELLDSSPVMRKDPKHVAGSPDPEMIEVVEWKEPKPRVRVAVVRVVAKMGIIDALPALIGALGHEDSFNRQAIITAIHGLGEAAAGPCLGRIVPLPYEKESFDKHMPQLLANGMLAVIAGQLGDQRAVPYLLDTLKLPREKIGADIDLTELYLQTVELLGRFKVERAGRPLAGMLRVEEAKVQELTDAVERSVREIGHPAARALAQNLYDPKDRKLDQFGMAPVFFRLLREPDLRTYHARDAILAFLAVDSDEVRYQATETLGLYLFEGVLDAYDLPALEAMYRDPNHDVQACCSRWRDAIAKKQATEGQR